MTSQTELLKTLLELPRTERAQLAHWLIESLESMDDSSNAEASWSAELDARLSAVDHGALAKGTADDVLRRASTAVLAGVE